MIELAAGVEDKTERSRVLGFLATQFDNYRVNEHTGEAYPFTTEIMNPIVTSSEGRRWG
jgi:hypothetical protein